MSVLMNNDEFEKKIIDFNKARRKKLRPARRRAAIIGGIAAIAATIVGLAVFFQAREVLTDKSFWQNFNSSAGSVSEQK